MLGGSFAPDVATEYLELSSSRRACALVPSSQLRYRMTRRIRGHFEIKTWWVPRLSTFCETLFNSHKLIVREVGEDRGERDG